MVESILCRRSVQSVWQRAVCAGGECRGYGRVHFMQERSVEGIAEGSMCKRGVQGVW